MLLSKFIIKNSSLLIFIFLVPKPIEYPKASILIEKEKSKTSNIFHNMKKVLLMFYILYYFSTFFILLKLKANTTSKRIMPIVVTEAAIYSTAEIVFKPTAPADITRFKNK